jgi:hypothetical protein
MTRRLWPLADDLCKGSTAVVERSKPTSRGGRPGTRRLAAAAVFSVLLHLFLTPLPGLIPALGALFEPALPPEPEIDEIPIELFSEEAPAAVAAAPPPAAPPEPPSVPPEPGVGPLAPPTKAPAAKKAAPETPTPASVPAGKPPEGPSVTGEGSPIVDSKAYVRALVYTDQVRSQRFAGQVARLMRRSPQWRDFFGPAQVDPLADLDRILIAGPSLRSSTNLVAVVQHHLPAARLNAAFEGLVARGGAWIDQKKRIARAEADHAERIFAAPNEHLVAVVPPSAEKSLKKLKKNSSFPGGREGQLAEVHLKNTSQVLKLFGVKLPVDLEASKAVVSVREGGGIVIELEATDPDEASAAFHATQIQDLITRATNIDFRRMGLLGGLASFALGGSKQKFIEVIRFHAKGAQILGRLELTASQVSTALGFAEGMLPPEPEPELEFPESQTEPSEATSPTPSSGAGGTTERSQPPVPDEPTRASGSGSSETLSPPAPTPAAPEPAPLPTPDASETGKPAPLPPAVP